MPHLSETCFGKYLLALWCYPYLLNLSGSGMWKCKSWYDLVLWKLRECKHIKSAENNQPQFKKMEEDISEIKVALKETTMSDEVFMVEQPTEVSYAGAITQVSKFLSQERNRVTSQSSERDRKRKVVSQMDVIKGKAIL